MRASAMANRAVHPREDSLKGPNDRKGFGCNGLEGCLFKGPAEDGPVESEAMHTSDESHSKGDSKKAPVDFKPSDANISGANKAQNRAHDGPALASRIAGWLLASALSLAGCDPIRDVSRHAPSAAQATQTPPSGMPSESREMAPRFPTLELFVNNRKSGGSNGCTTTFFLIPGGPTHTGPKPLNAAHSSVEHTMRCGHPGAVSKVTWSYTGTDSRGDHLRLERTFPDEEPNAATTSIEIVFTGEELTVFEDDFQRVIVRTPTEVDATGP